jgi:hypothetical protein
MTRADFEAQVMETVRGELAAQLCDALEVQVWRDDGPTATIDELRVWFRRELSALRG